MPRAPVALLLSALLAGCASTDAPEASVALAEGAPAKRAMDWSDGNWWAYHAQLEGVAFDVALIVHAAEADGFRLGTNLSSGFFGLPWNGNVSSDKNPRIGAEEWKLYAFPLADGKEWRHTILGHDARTTARAATIEVPGLGPRAGYQFESTSYGQIFARYDYAPEVGWFTRLQLIEPTDGHVVLDAQLAAFGPDWGEAYFVEETIRQVRVEHPALPGSIPVTIPEGYLQVRATLLVQSATGIAAAEIRDESGRILGSARVIGRGVDSDRATARPHGDAVWALEHWGVGTASILLEITGVAPNGPLADAEAQNTRPSWPQFGHTILAPSALGV